MCRSNVTQAFLFEFLSTFKTYLSKSSNENLPCQIFQSIHSAIFWLGGFKNCAASLCDWCRARHRRQFNHHGAKVTISSYAFPFKKMPLWFNLQHESYLPRFQCVSRQDIDCKMATFSKIAFIYNRCNTYNVTEWFIFKCLRIYGTRGSKE